MVHTAAGKQGGAASAGTFGNGHSDKYRKTENLRTRIGAGGTRSQSVTATAGTHYSRDRGRPGPCIGIDYAGQTEPILGHR